MRLQRCTAAEGDLKLTCSSMSSRCIAAEDRETSLALSFLIAENAHRDVRCLDYLFCCFAHDCMNIMHCAWPNKLVVINFYEDFRKGRFRFPVNCGTR